MISLKREGLLDDGTYRLRIDDIEQKPGSSGFDYLNIKYTVLVNGQPYGSSIWDIVSLSPKSRFIMESLLDSIGAPNTSEEVSVQWFKGKFVWANIITGEYKGKLKNEVDSYVAASVAEKFLEAESVTDPHTDEDFSTPVKKRRAPADRTGKVAQAVAEMEDDGFPV